MLWQDVRCGLRALVKSSGFTAVAVLTLALGIGANSAIFSVVNAVLLRPLPYQDPDRLVMVWATNLKRGYQRDVSSYPQFLEWKQRNHVFADLAAGAGLGVNLTGVDMPERLFGWRVTSNLFALLGASPSLGRSFSPDEEQPGKNRVVILSDGLWRRRFAADPGVLGQTMQLNGESYSVIGVMPASFRFPPGDSVLPFDLWVPLTPEDRRGHGYLQVIGRLKPGVKLAQAQTEMEEIARQLAVEYPKWNAAVGVNLVPLHDQVAGDVRPALLLFSAAVGCVLLIACANVANLLLARSLARRTETATRAALGASRGRLVRQFLVESVILSGLGGSLGLLLAGWGIDALLAVVPANIFPSISRAAIGIDTRVLGFTVLLSFATGLLFGMAPAMRASQADLIEDLKEGRRTSSESAATGSLKNILVVSQVALSLALLISAGLLLKSFVLLLRVSPGFRPENLVTMRIDRPRPSDRDWQRHAAFFTEVLRRVEALPGVRSAAFINVVPFSGSQDTLSFQVEGRPARPGEQFSAGDREISSDYFHAMGIPLLKGRPFTASDVDGAPRVAIVNESMARWLWPNEEPLGKRLTTEGPAEWREVVGVVGDVRHSRLELPPRPEMFLPYPQFASTSPGLTLIVQADSPARLVAAIRREILVADKDQPVTQVATMEQLLAESVASRRFNMLVVGIFAAMALALAGSGVYGVVSYSVSRRTHEIGIRMALGAAPRDVVKIVVGQGVLYAVIGVTAGAAASVALTRALSTLLYAVPATDPTTFLLASSLLAGVALLASYIPARRATRIDPIVALRHE